MPTLELTQQNFDAAIKENDILLVDFWAPWCGPCRSFAPIYAAAAERYPELVFGKVNTEEEQALAGALQIRSIPTLMIFREQVILFSQPGLLPPQALDEIIGRLKDLDMDEVHKEIRQQEAQASNKA